MTRSIFPLTVYILLHGKYHSASRLLRASSLSNYAAHRVSLSDPLTRNDVLRTVILHLLRYLGESERVREKEPLICAEMHLHPV